MSLPSGAAYRVFAPRRAETGGKRVSVFEGTEGDLQARAATAGTPLSAFIASAQAGEVHLRVFTPQREKGESDSASVAALAHLQAQGHLADFATVQTENGSTSAQLCGGEWLLLQGSPGVSAASAAQAGALGLSFGAAHIASTERPNLVLEVPDLAQLQGFVEDAETISALGQVTDTTGLILYCLTAPGGAGLSRADLSFRAFGPLRGFVEDAASSNMCACLVAVLGERGLWPQGSFTLRAAQLQPGQPSLLTAQFSEVGEAVWVGGRAEREE